MGGTSEPGVLAAATTTVWSLFAARAVVHPDRVAIIDGERSITYRHLAAKVASCATALAVRGVRPGDRVALLSENRMEILEVLLAAARLGAIVACQNWRLTATELKHCISLVEPTLCVVSSKHQARLAEATDVPALVFGPMYANALAAIPAVSAQPVDPESPLVILYTSGTTGLPKGAVINHRAQIVRNIVTRAEFWIAPEDTFVAWSPLYHMGAVDNSLGTLMAGGTVIVVDGFDPEKLCEIVATTELGWLLLMPGMVGRFAAELEKRQIRPAGIRVCGVMADLVPPAEIAKITELLDAPYANTFGATETGCPPCSSSLIPIGVAPTRLSKMQSPFCEVRLLDADDKDVPLGSPGELAMRGPTLFSGYWKASPAAEADDVNAREFRGGWFHMGDVFVRNPDGTLDFVDRVKYLIKSGGENVYPAEIERVLLRDPRVAEAAVVRMPDPKWGEVPVAFVARVGGPLGASLEDTSLFELCRTELAGFKQPKQIRFITVEEFPRSASGKVVRHELEKRLSTEKPA